MAKPTGRVTPRTPRPTAGIARPTGRVSPRPKPINRPATAAMTTQRKRSVTGMQKIVEKRRAVEPRYLTPKASSQTTYKKKGGGFAR